LFCLSLSLSRGGWKGTTTTYQMRPVLLFLLLLLLLCSSTSSPCFPLVSRIKTRNAHDLLGEEKNEQQNTRYSITTRTYACFIRIRERSIRTLSRRRRKKKEELPVKTTVPAEVRARMKTNENESRRNPKKTFTRAQEDKYTTIIITYTTRRYALYSPRAASICDIPMRFSRWTIPCLHRQQQQYACTLWRIYTRTHPITLLEIEVRCLIYHVRS